MERDYSINRRIREYIDTNDKRPTAIADKSGIRRDTFSRIINCKRPLYAEEIMPVCNALGIAVSCLFNEKGA